MFNNVLAMHLDKPKNIIWHVIDLMPDIRLAAGVGANFDSVRSAAEPNWLTRSRISLAVTLRSCPQNAKTVAYIPLGVPPRNLTPLQLWRLLPSAVLLKMPFVLPRLNLIQLANPPPVEVTTNIRCLPRVSVARMLTGQVACS